MIVKGNITLYTAPGFNEYEINVSSITSATDGIKAFNISQVEKQLLKIIEDRVELIDIRARGRINQVNGLPDNVLSLNDSNSSAILCEFHNNKLPNQDKEEVFVQGKICNFSARNRIQYRIDVAETKPYSSDDRYRTMPVLWGPKCGNQCDQPSQSCELVKSCRLTSVTPSDELYKLCPRCYRKCPSRDHEGIEL